MKKFISVCFVALAFVLSSTAIAQQNITYVVKEKKEGKDRSIFYFNLKGFTDQKQAELFYDKIRALPNVSGVQDLGKDPNGVYVAVAKLKEKPSLTPVEMAEKLGITHVEKGRTTMTLAEWKEESTHKGEPSRMTK